MKLGQLCCRQSSSAGSTKFVDGAAWYGAAHHHGWRFRLLVAARSSRRADYLGPSSRSFFMALDGDSESLAFARRIPRCDSRPVCHDACATTLPGRFDDGRLAHLVDQVDLGLELSTPLFHDRVPTGQPTLHRHSRPKCCDSHQASPCLSPPLAGGRMALSGRPVAAGPDRPHDDPPSRKFPNRGA